MLDQQIEAYAALDRMRLMVLGLLGMGVRVEALLAIPRDDGGRALPCPMSDFLLGIVALNRSLQASLGANRIPDAAPAPQTTPGRSERILR